MIEFRKPISPARFRIAVGGDICPGPYGSELARRGRAAEIFAPLAPFLDDADLRILQFESPLPAALAPIPKTGPNIASTPETADILKDRFDVALLANNHIGDHGPQGVLDTIRELHARGIATVGAGANRAEAEAPLRIEVAGHPISILNYAEFEFGIADEDSPGAAPQRPLADIRTIAAEAKAKRTVVVVLHGGHEQYPFPSPRLRDLCRAFADAGASLVVNCHEHCPQGVEWHGGVPIVYCPGNLWFPPNDPASPEKRPPLWNFGYIAKVSFDDDGPFAIELLPYKAGNNEVRPLEGSLREAFLGYVRRLSETITDTMQLQAFFDAWCVESGRPYFEGSSAALQDRPPSDTTRFLPMRNLFTCESHHDLVRRFLRISAEGRVETASCLRSEISALQNPRFALIP